MEDAEKTQGGTEGEEVAKVEANQPEQSKEVDFSAYEPEVRKRPIDYIKEREARRAERQADDRPFESADTSATEELTPAARKVLEQEIQKRLEPITKYVAKDANDREMQEFLSQSGNEHFRQYAPLAKKYMDTPEYQGVPAKRIFQMLDYEFAIDRGASAAKSERRAVRGGSSIRPTAQTAGISTEDIARMTPQQFEAFQARLNQGEKIQTE